MKKTAKYDEEELERLQAISSNKLLIVRE